MFNQADLDIIRNANCRLVKGGVTITSPVEVVANDTFAIVANAGYILNKVTWKNQMNAVVTWTLSIDKTQASTKSSYTGAQLSNLIVDSTVKVITGCFSPEFLKTINDNNCDLYKNGVLISSPYGAVLGESFEVKCREGWIFTNEPDTLGGYAVYGRYLKAGGVWTIEQWAVSADRKTASIKLTATRAYAYMFCLTEQTAPIDVLGGVNNVYKVDADIMKALTKERFFMSTSGTGGEYMTFDYGQFILNLLQIPFALPIKNIIGSEPIKLAKLETTVVAPMVNTDRINYDLGNITISGNHGNLLDYSTKQAILHLPFSDPIILDNQYVIDKTITINLEVNLYTGVGTYNIYSTAIDEVILTKTVSLGVNIPLANFYSSDPKQILNSSLEWSGDNKLRIAYIELVDTNSDLNSGFFNTPIMDDVVLSEVKGFFTVINANLSLRATSSEKSQIQSMLQSGVIYK